MKKRFTRGAIIAMAATCITASSASAALYGFEDMIDTWGIWGDAVPIVEGAPLNYVHDLNQEVDFAGGHKVTAAKLKLDFTNDLLDTTFIWDFREFVTVGFNENGWSYVNLGEVDNGQYKMALNIDWLNDDGFLDVQLSAWNPGCNPATAWLDHSKVYGTAETPEPATMLLFGTGLAGLAGIGRRKRK